MVDDGHGLVIFARHACRIIAPFRDAPCSQITPNRENFYGDTVDGQACKSILSKNRVPANLSVYNNIVYTVVTWSSPVETASPRMSREEKNLARKQHCGRRLYRWSGSRVGDATTIDSGRYRVRVSVR